MEKIDTEIKCEFFWDEHLKFYQHRCVTHLYGIPLLSALNSKHLFNLFLQFEK